MSVREVKALFLNGPKFGSSCEFPDSVNEVVVPTIIETCIHYLGKGGSLNQVVEVIYRKEKQDTFGDWFFVTKENYAEAYFCQQCYSEKKATLEAEKLKESIRREVIYELQTFLKEFE